MHGVWAAVAAATLLALAAARRSDQDFEFDDDADTETLRSHRPRPHIYNPHNALCRSLVCKKREVCVLRDDNTALCADRKEVLRDNEVLAASNSESAAWERDIEDDVFYDAGAREDAPLATNDFKTNRCVGCGSAGRAQFLCGSDNRTYSSLCRLDLHNCVRRPARPVTLACRGFCPCRRRRQNHDTEEWRWRKTDASHNEVLPERTSRRRSQGPEGCALDNMANRLLDWFSVLMDEAKGTAPPEDGFPTGCKPEVRWMFAHLDTAGDGALSSNDLYALRHDARERCLRPFLASCGGSRGVTRAAWCACLRRAARPCAALARAHPAPRPGAYVPACDARGFYRPRQCHAAIGVCWCVDPHGVELQGSRTKGAPTCPGESEGPLGGVPADDEDASGSGDSELHF